MVGKTGAGKSSLLLAMCSEVEMTQGSGKLVGRIAYLEQQPWIMNDTMRANILFTREFDENFYWKVLHACALIDDLEMWPSGDMTVI
ncbi:ATPase-like protein, partial [Coemansia sp. RSA 2611]